MAVAAPEFTHHSPEEESGERPLSRSEERLAGEYRLLANQHRHEIPLDQFTHVGREEAARDQLEVRRVHASFHTAVGGERALLMENFLEVEVDRSDWFGATTFRTTRYDDYKNGVDLVFEWEKEDGDGVIPRLAVDVTTARIGTVLARKKTRADAPTPVKYFRSDVTGKDLSILVPDVILSVRPEVIALLAEEADKARVTKIGRGQNNEVVKTQTLSPQAFAEHPIQLLLLEQARAQLERLIVLLDTDDAWDYNLLPPEMVARLDAFESLPDTERSYRGLAEIFASVPGMETAKALKQVRTDGRNGQNKQLEWKQRIAVYRRVLRKIKELEEKMNNTPAYRRRVVEFREALRRLGV